MRRQAKAAFLGTERSDSDSGRSRGPLVLFAALTLASLVALTAMAGAVPPEYVESFGPDGTATSDFELVNSVAVDSQTGNVYVLDSRAGALYKFDSEGQPVNWGGTAPYIAGNRIEGLSPYLETDGIVAVHGISQIAVDSQSHVVYVTEEHAVRAFHANGEPAEFTAGAGAGTSEIPGFTELTGVAVDANGAIYASNSPSGRTNPGTVAVYASTGALLNSFEGVAGWQGNLAVASDGVVYVASGAPAPGGGAYKFTPSEFPVTATTTYIDGPDFKEPGLSFTVGVGVDPLTDDVYTIQLFTQGGWIRRYDSSGNFVRSWGEPGTPSDAEGFGAFAQGIAVLGSGKELQLYVGNSEKFESPAYSKVDVFGTNIVEGPPTIKSTSAIDVTADSATLRAQINPNTAETTYRFEYGLEDCGVSACTSVPIDGATIGAGFEPVNVTQTISGLQAGTTYHYRVVAESSFGPTEGPDAAFTTQTSGLGFQLADNRAWEMVSPPKKFGGVLRGAAEGVIQAAEDGEGIAYVSTGSIEVDPDASRATESTAVLARRGPEGWRSKDISPPNGRSMGLVVGDGSEYNLFSNDLSHAAIKRRDGTPLSEQASERTPYLRENTEPATYTPLVTGKEGFANVPPGTKFGGDETKSGGLVKVAGATSDLNHVALRSTVSLATGAPGSGESVYLWTAGELDPVAVPPDAEGGGMVPAVLGSGVGSTQHAISEDGARVFWGAGLSYTSTNNSLTALYLRDMEAGETVRLDVVQPGASGTGTANPAFQGASDAGTVVFFTDSRQLTEDASPSGYDLYRCEIPPGAVSAGCATLTDVSAPLPGSGESAEMLGIRSALSEDASRIYFVARGVLDEAPNQHGDSAVSGAPNLYLWEEGEGTRFIATLAAKDASAWGLGEANAFGRVSDLNAAGSPSGRYLSFMSQRSLTGYDNRDASSDAPLQEVFRYDAIEDRLECVSCNPTGARPDGAAPPDYGLVNPSRIWTDKPIAAVLPQTAFEEIALNRPRAVLDNGRVFFNAIDSLVPADSNGQWDVYQYEPTGVGDCTASSGGASIVRLSGGCVSLISSGTAEEEAGFLDASATGGDVFFLSSAKLSVTDEDEELDVYDARVDGVPATLPPSAECLGEACQPAVIAPDDPTPASAGFRGQGNPKPEARKRCTKGKRLVRRGGKARCVARKQSRKGKASKNRRASR